MESVRTAAPRGEMGQRIMLLLTLLVLSFSLVPCETSAKQERAGFPIDSKAYERFIACKGWDQVSIFEKRLFAENVPLKKEPDYWSFAVTGEIMGLPVKIMDVGVCGPDGERDCGWSLFHAFTIDKPLEETRKYLLERYGVDFTEEKRDGEIESTLRPVLTPHKETGETVLYCDPGTL